jgi:hypothetical protein
MPMFIARPNDPPFQQMLDKLIAAGWVRRTLLLDKAPETQLAKIEWTDEGRRKMARLLELLSEIEQASMPLENDEIPFLKHFAQLATHSDGSGAPPFRP